MAIPVVGIDKCEFSSGTMNTFTILGACLQEVTQADVSIVTGGVPWSIMNVVTSIDGKTLGVMATPPSKVHVPAPDNPRTLGDLTITINPSDPHPIKIENQVDFV